MGFYRISKTDSRALLHGLIVMLFFPKVVQTQCPVNPDCSCSDRGGSITCYPTCGPAIPRFLGTTVRFSSLGIYGKPTRDIIQIGPKAFEGQSALSSLFITRTGIYQLDCQSFSGLGQSLRTLNMQNNFLRDVPKCAIDGLRLLTTLDLNSNNITQMHNSDFANLTNLITLDLRNNRISVIEVNAFDGLGTLQNLYLHGNAIPELDKNVFVNLQKLYNLYLQGNNLITVVRGTFSGLVKLRLLYLNNNNITSLDEHVFSGLNELYNLRLDNNRIAELPSGIFDGLGKLAYLYLNYNNLTTLQTRAFVGNAKLNRLQLQNNQIANIETGAFRDVFGPVYLDMSNNHLVELDGRVFLDIPNITALVLKNNRVVRFQGTFHGLYKLLTIDMSGNGLTEMPESLLAGAPNLTTLRLRDNFISTLHATSFATLPKLQSLQLTNNSLTELGDSLLGLGTSLRSLDLSNNYLSTVNGQSLQRTLGSIRYLDQLSLSNNPLIKFPLNSEQRIRSVSLRNCSLNAIPNESLQNISGLSYLDISLNDLGSVDMKDEKPGSFYASLTCLDLCFFTLVAENNSLPTFNLQVHSENKQFPTYLRINLHLANNSISNPIEVIYGGIGGGNLQIYISDLSDNGITTLSHFPIKLREKYGSISQGNSTAFWKACDDNNHIRHTIDISNLDLRWNSMSYISPSACLGMVYNLDLSNNELETIGPLVSNATFMRLGTLNLARNRIRNISSDAFDEDHGHTLNTLDLSANRLTGFRNLNYLLTSGRFRKLKMADNPIDCSCDLFWVRNTSVAHKLDKVRCHSPERVRGYLVVCFPVDNCQLSERTVVDISDATKKLCNEDTYLELSDLSLMTATTGEDVNMTWQTIGPGKVTGYELNYTDTRQPNNVKSTLIHQDLQSFAVYRLHPGSSYNICITALPVEHGNDIMCGIHYLTSMDSRMLHGNEVVIPLAVVLGICIIVIISLITCMMCRRHDVGCFGNNRADRENKGRREDMVIKNITENPPVSRHRLNSYEQGQPVRPISDGEEVYEDLDVEIYENS